MNTSFWSHCQGLVRRLQYRHRARPRERQCPWGIRSDVAADVLEARCLLSAVPVPSGVVAWWSGDVTATDQMGLNDGTLANGAGYAAANVGSGFNFDGVDDNFQASTVGFPTGNANRTIELWVRIDQQVADETFFASYGAPGSFEQAFVLGALSSGELFVSNWGHAVVGPTLQNGQWHHVAATNVGNSCTLYLDGATVATGTMPLNTPAGSTFWLGRLTESDLGGITRRLDGMVDEVTVYNRALSASEIATIYNAGSDGKIKAPTPSLAVSGFPATITAGSAGSFSITAKNADGTTNTGYRGTVRFTSSDPQAVLPADYTFTAADNGVRTFTASLKTAGSQAITATDTQAPGMAGAQASVLVKPAAASTMTVGDFPSTATAGVAGNLTVTLKDPFGNIASGYTGTVRFTSSDAQAVLPANYTFTAADAGTHTFSVTLNTFGTRSITAADTLNSALTATRGGITVNSGPAMVADIVPGSNSSNPGNLVAIGATIYFTASDGTHGQELWKSDASGTRMVKDINLGAGDSSPGDLANVNGTLYFSASDGMSGVELWKSDGTTTGTVRVKDINPGSGSSHPASFANVNGTIYFRADDGAHGFELWKTDGTTTGTTLVTDIAPGGYTGYFGGYYFNSLNPTNLTNVNGTLFFSAGHVMQSSWQLWKSDGTAAGTVPVGPGNGVGQMTNVNGTLFFAGYGADGIELWKSDGTAAGTTLVKDIFPGTHHFAHYDYYGNLYTYPNNSTPNGLTNVNGTLYFSANDGTNGYELWKSDGTGAGTVMVKDITPGSAGSHPADLTNVNGTLFFTADDLVNGRELWQSNGTAAGTVRVTDIVPGPGSVGPQNLVNANGKLFFTATDGVHGNELWALNTLPAPGLGVSGFPATTTAGSSGSFTITAKNADGTTNTGYRGTVRFTSTDPQAVLPGDYTFTAADNGVHTFAATLKTAGSQSITATDLQASGMSGQSNTLVKAAAASTMTIGGFPSTVTAGSAGSFTVTLKDPYGNIATAYTGTVRFSSNDAKAVLPANYTFIATDAGKHTFSATLKTAGTRSITAADTLQSALTATAGGITVNAAAASKFVITAPTSVRAGTSFSVTLTVTDAYGNVAIGYTGTVRFTSTDKKATLPANYTFKASDKGVRTFTGLVLRTRGQQKLMLTDILNASLTASVTESVT